MNPTQISARKTAGGARFDLVLFSALDALEAAKIPFALIGGVAVGGQGRPRSTHDIDLFVRPEDAESVLQSLEAHEFRPERYDVEWLYKAFKDEILVDIVFRSRGDIYFDEEMQANVKHVDYHGRKVPVVCPEDLIIIKCAVHFEGGPHHWYDALALLSHAEIRWDYLLKRARRAPRRLLALLLYAQSNDIWVPNHMVVQLFEHIFADERKPAAAAAASPLHASQSAATAPAVNPRYLAEHIREALVSDGRTAQQDVKVLVEDGKIVVKGEATTEARRKSIVDVVHAIAPGYEVENHVRVTPVAEPERAEELH